MEQKLNCCVDGEQKSALTVEMVREIRRQHYDAVPIVTIAERFAVSPKQVFIAANTAPSGPDAGQYQAECLDFCLYDGFGDNPIYPALGVANETGELLGKIKKIMRGDYELTDEVRQQITDEMGDVLFYVAVLGFELGIPLSLAMSRNIDKLRDRAARGVIKGDGDNR